MSQPYRTPGDPLPSVVRLLRPEEQAIANADPLWSPFAEVMNPPRKHHADATGPTQAGEDVA